MGDSKEEERMQDQEVADGKTTSVDKKSDKNITSAIYRTQLLEKGFPEPGMKILYI